MEHVYVHKMYNVRYRFINRPVTTILRPLLETSFHIDIVDCHRDIVRQMEKKRETLITRLSFYLLRTRRLEIVTTICNEQALFDARGSKIGLQDVG